MYYKKIYLPNGEEKLISCEDLEARYDSEGNEISSFYLPRDEAVETYLTQADAEETYLPLSAGINKPLTDGLYIKNGNRMAHVYVDANGTWVRHVENGVDKGGVRFSPGGYATLFGAGQAIEFKPNGPDNNTGRVYIGSDGQTHGGIKAWAKSASSISISAGANTSMGKITGLSGSGIFAIAAYGHIDYNASPYPDNAYINLYRQSAGVIGYYTQSAKRSRTWIHCFDFATNITEVDFKVEPINACKAWLEMYVWQLS